MEWDEEEEGQEGEQTTKEQERQVVHRRIKKEEKEKDLWLDCRDDGVWAVSLIGRRSRINCASE